MKSSTIIVKSLTKKDSAVSVEDGLVLHYQILDLLKKNDEKITLDFSDVVVLAHQYLISSIGLLLKDYKVDYLQERLIFEGMNQHQKWLLNYIINNAIECYDKKSA